jgi:uncharacterized protein
MDVDIARQRIALSMRLDDEPGQARGGKPAGGGEARGGRDNRGPRPGAPSPKPAAAPSNSAFADALSRALKR